MAPTALDRCDRRRQYLSCAEVYTYTHYHFEARVANTSCDSDRFDQSILAVRTEGAFRFLHWAHSTCTGMTSLYMALKVFRFAMRAIITAYKMWFGTSSMFNNHGRRTTKIIWNLCKFFILWYGIFYVFVIVVFSFRRRRGPLNSWHGFSIYTGKSYPRRGCSYFNSNGLCRKSGAWIYQNCF